MPTATNGNGRVVLPPGVQIGRELGSAWGAAGFDERIFESYEDGKVFLSPYDLRDCDIDLMLRHDGKARALEQVLTLPLRAASWSIEPADGDTGEAEFAREALTTPANNGGMSTPLDLVIGQLTSAVLYRRAFFEKVWKVDEQGRLVYDKLAFRPAKTCWLARDPDTQAFRGFKQKFKGRDGAMEEATIPAEKALVYVHGQHRDPLNGSSDLQTAYACFESKQKVRFLWYSFLEGQTIPKGVAKHSTADAGEIQEFARKVATLKGGGVVGIGPDQDVKPYESSGAGAAIFQEAMRYLDQEMFASCLAGFADLAGAASSGRGSFALSKDQSDFFLRSRQAVLGEMGAVLTGFMVADLIRWNFGRAGKVPAFKFGELTGVEAGDVIAVFEALATSVTPSPAVPREFVEMLVEKVAARLDMDVDRVRAAIDGQASPDAGQGDQFRQAIDNAARLVQEAGIGATPSADTSAAVPAA